MKITYAIFHWMFTLLLAPFTSFAIEYIASKGSDNNSGLLELYPYAILFSLLFSIPTLVVYLICFHHLKSHNASSLIAKFTLIVVSIAGTFITVSIILGRPDKDFIFPYSLTAIIVGLVLKIGSPSKKQPEAE